MHKRAKSCGFGFRSSGSWDSLVAMLEDDNDEVLVVMVVDGAGEEEEES
jgi:hypothetical protein